MENTNVEKSVILYTDPNFKRFLKENKFKMGADYTVDTIDFNVTLMRTNIIEKWNEFKATL